MLENDRVASLASAVLRFRRERTELFPTDLFNEPAWDLLLELFLADAEGRRLTAREAAKRSDIAPSVMSRWLQHLSKIGYVVGDGTGDLDDLLTLSAQAMGQMEQIMNRAHVLHATVK